MEDYCIVKLLYRADYKAIRDSHIIIMRDRHIIIYVERSQQGAPLLSKFLMVNPVLVDLSELSTRISSFLKLTTFYFAYRRFSFV